ncbi:MULTISPECIES: hypothetical protein [Bradyrhizobium]|uniref:Uncharacterized protein n=1 Tax=Bradyrhizobium yuanmingense TaxID=108015 RepID=A0A1C3WYJ0_9BRAD|nr:MULTISPECIES: hypothetical protein [Bradyrhizobium]MCA1383862.1 hypothetical protein [Bradyrhizobium sp. BRP05]MCA1375928.1 hypothetical protein [Bradyrhizobium sp. IC4060]MCA1387681.1 hypothetical protein [Bradyrhizobium sp. IC3123]MCA1414936.1 hypothetical protein [Bradyrhizobium sp. NBAIM20]MCA1418100.1 hypothetical protein [Bradyrhizobium sp. BRP23]
MDREFRRLEHAAREQAALSADGRTKAALLEIAEEYRLRADYLEAQKRSPAD